MITNEMKVQIESELKSIFDVARPGLIYAEEPKLEYREYAVLAKFGFGGWETEVEAVKQQIRELGWSFTLPFEAVKSLPIGNDPSDPKYQEAIEKLARDMVENGKSRWYYQKAPGIFEVSGRYVEVSAPEFQQALAKWQKQFAYWAELKEMGYEAATKRILRENGHNPDRLEFKLFRDETNYRSNFLNTGNGICVDSVTDWERAQIVICIEKKARPFYGNSPKVIAVLHGYTLLKGYSTGFGLYDQSTVKHWIVGREAPWWS